MNNDALTQTLQQYRLADLSRFSPEQVATLLQETQLGEDGLALALLPLARQKSQVPVSGFRVGAIAIGGSGHWYLGANMETAGLPLNNTLHAEQAAIGHAALFDEHHIEKIVVSASPCGHCRQFMHELNQTSLMLVLPDEHFMLDELLPHAFGPADLGQTYGMLNSTAGSLGLHSKTPQNLACLAALDEANASYAPYSHNRAGVALLLDNGHLCLGRYLENAAFNPGLGPMQLALSQLFLQGYSTEQIQRAFIVEAKAEVQQYDAAARLLSQWSAVTLERLVLDTVRREA